MYKTIVCCITAVVVAIVLAGGINRAAFYIMTAILSYLKDRDDHRR